MDWRDFFSNKIGGLSTDKYLQNRELSEKIKPLIDANIDADALWLQKSLEFAQSSNSESLSTSRVVLTNHALELFAGSELWTIETAQFLQSRGVDVMIYSPRIGGVASLATDCGIVVTSLAEDVISFDPDILHVNHYATVLPLIESVCDKSKIVNMVHGLLPKPGMPGERYVTKYCGVSVAAKAKVHLVTGVKWKDITGLPNYFNEARFVSSERAIRGRKALIHSSRTTPLQRESLKSVLEAYGIELEHIGRGGGLPTSEPEAWLSKFDIVFAVGRSAIEGMASGAHVILWDAGIVGPAVTPQNFWKCMAANFALSGNALPWRSAMQADARSWITDEILKCSEQSRRDTTDLTRTHLTLDRVGRRLIETYSSLLNPPN